MKSTNNTIVRDLTGGNVTRLLLQFAFPLFVSNALQAIYNIVDMIVVGQFIGGTGMSAVSIGGDLLGFVLEMGCQGFWFGDALAGFMPMVIGTVFYLSGRWKTPKTSRAE